MIDVLVIGSGFGGAVMAARLAPAVKALGGGRRLVLLEHGADPSGALDPHGPGQPLNAQGNRFRHTLSPRYLDSLARLYTDTHGHYRSGTPSMAVATGRALGGGSQVYDGVSLRAPTEAFEQLRDGRRLWPARYTRAALDPLYATVEQRLKVRRLAWTDASAPHWALTTKRDAVFAEGCRRIGATAVPLKVATSDDANEGWWNEGPRFSGRQSLTLNYLADAAAAGAELQTGCEVERVAPRPGGGYVVTGKDHRTNQPLELECRVLVVACGAVGSSALLLRSQEAFDSGAPLDPHGLLGKRLSANGDYGVTGSVGAAVGDVEGFKGKPMSSFCPSFYKQHGFIVIPFYAAPLFLSLGQFTSVLRARAPMAVGRGSTDFAPGERDWGAAFKQRMTTFGARMLTMGCLAFDDGEGEVKLGPRGPEVAWRETSAATEARWSAALTVMRRIYEALGGELYLDAYRERGTVHTSHPLGGVPMASEARHGVVDENGESFTRPDLFVVDGAIIPSSLCANPSLTIAAVAEGIAARLVAGQGMRRLADRL
ncbi:MAG: GMC family oxidoreductase [Myxococcaceae bacterium]|nr:GMC family oxidoreductase [Myxococcaceae bacterium]